ncbi:MAG: PCRF domain-containing protein, partial [Peptostreptococcaceae bacterium]
MLERLDFLENKYDELSNKIGDPSVMANQKEWQKLCKEHSELEIIVGKYREYRNAE